MTQLPDEVKGMVQEALLATTTTGTPTGRSSP